MKKKTIILLSKILYGNNLIWNIKTKEKEVFLTFDDGPNPVTTQKILEILEEHKVKATFFCLGENVEKHWNIFEKIIKRFHRIGSHGYEHINGWKANRKYFLKNIIRNKSVFKSRLFRPPYGAITPSQAKAVSKQFKVIMWSLMTFDYSSKTNPQECLDRLVKKVKPGDIIVFHDSVKAQENCLYILPKFIKSLKQQGYKFSILN